MFDARIVANFILDHAENKGKAITNLDLQKILYFVHGHYLVQFHEALVVDEFEAWNYGPVHRTVYDVFKEYNDMPIEGRALAFDPVRRQKRELPQLTDGKAISIIHRVLDYYLDMPTFLRVQMTHSEGTPWTRTVQAAEKRPNLGMKISNQLIEECFEGIEGEIQHAE